MSFCFGFCTKNSKVSSNRLINIIIIKEGLMSQEKFSETLGKMIIDQNFRSEVKNNPDTALPSADLTDEETAKLKKLVDVDIETMSVNSIREAMGGGITGSIL